MTIWLKGRAPARPFEAFQIEVTSRCNLKCVMCPVTVLAERWAQRDLPWETFERVAEAFARVKWVYLQGWGEPLLHRRVFDMIARAKSAGCRVGFTTNGTRLTPQTGARLLDLGLDLLAVSIAGASPATHEAIRVGSDFAKLVENLRRFASLRRELRSATPKIEVFYLMTPANLAELPQAVQLAAQLGADELVATNLDYVITPGLDALRAYSGSPPARACRAVLDEAAAAARAAGIAFRPYRLQFREMAVCDLNPLKILFVGSDGSVSPCVYTSLAGPSEIPRVFEGRPLETPVVRFGNVNERPLMEIWESAAYREFRGQLARRVAGAGLAMLGAAAGAAPDEESPAPEACRTCPKLYGV
ncbi:MAG TPA: radical SAM protein [Burkholderiales bacterium]|nr:radical SAM protein [Burkholderiales bacterium]